jgi:DNA-binding transcriptional regulator YdaS (Cro superfamily)
MDASVDPGIRRLRKQNLLPGLARRLKLSRQAVYAWTQVPHERVLEVARITGMTPHQLRPDLYPKTLNGQRIK